MQRLDAGEVIRSSRFGYELAHTLQPDDADMRAKITQAEAEQSLRRGLVLPLEHRRAAGRFPGSLSALPVSAVPPHPFTGLPLVCRRTLDGFILCSVGPDLKVGGGRVAKNAKGVRRDLVLRYPA